MLKQATRISTYLSTLLAVTAFTWTVLDVRAEEDSRIAVFAAASLIEVVQDIGVAYGQQDLGTLLTVYASSAALARQIENGAPADVFLSANVAWITHLIEQDVLDAQSCAPIAANVLVLIAPAQSDLDVDLNNGAMLRDALKAKRLVIGDPAGVPAGMYAKQALQSLDAYEDLIPTLIFASDVRMALAWVARNEVDAGIVYGTDALISPDIRIVGNFPPASYEPIIYWAGVTRTAKPQATTFIRFLRSQTAQDIFTRHGFATMPQHIRQDTLPCSP